MELGEVVLLAKGDLGSLRPAAPELEIHAHGHWKCATLQLVWSRQGADGLPEVLATVDRQLTNRDAQLPQNRRGVTNPTGQLQSVVAAGLVDMQVVSVTPVASGLLAVRATVCLLPSAFDLVVPEQTSRVAASLDEGAAAAAAAASVAGALLAVVEMLRECRERAGDTTVTDDGDMAVTAEGDLPPGDPGPSTSTGVRKGSGVFTASGSAPLSQRQQGGDEEHHQYSDVRDEIFDIVAPRDWHTTHPNPAGLKCKLFPYQQRALSWMVWRETQPELGRDSGQKGRAGGAAEADDVVAAATAAARAHLGDFASHDLFWRRVEVRGGRELWVNPFPGGGLRKEPPPPPRRQRVGILADEMGLGKTVEVIGLMLARPPPKQQQQQRNGTVSVSGSGSAQSGRVCGPNLIVTPPSILQQWSIEIANHSNLKVYVYDGLRWHRQQSEEKERGRIKEAKREARLAEQREKEAKRQERARQIAERAAARAAKQQARQARKRTRGASETRGSARGRTRRRGTDGQGLNQNDDDTEEDDDDGDHDHKDEEEEGADAAGADGETMEGSGHGSGRVGGLHRAGASHAGPSTLGDAGSGEPGGAGSDGANGAPHPPRQKPRVKFAAGVRSPGAVAGARAGPTTSTSGHQGPGGSRAAASGTPADHRAGGGGGLGPGAAAGGGAARRPSRAPRRSYAAMHNGVVDSDSDNNADGHNRAPKRSSIRKGVAGAGGAAAAQGSTAPAAAMSGSAGAAAPSSEAVPSAATAAAAAATGSQKEIGTGPGAMVAATGGAAGGSAAGGAVPSRMQLYHRELMVALYAGTPLCPASCDPQAEARAAVQELLSADVVLTTYSVLKEEVHYSPTNRVLSGLRHEKKYSVPESPLLQIQWHRLVMDEAQMVGGSYSHVVTMASRIEATHRWCVTGTPIGAGGLDDLRGLLCVLKYTPYDDPSVFKHLISDPYRAGTGEGHSRLAALIKPIMWRNSKAVAAQDHPLPRRVLQEAHLRFSTAEEAFYDVILGETRKAYNEMASHQQQQHQQQHQRAPQQEEQQPTLQQGPQQQSQGAKPQGSQHTAAELIDLTAEDEGQAAAGGGTGPSSHPGGNGATGYQGSSTPAKQPAKHPGQHGKRRRQDRGAALAQLAGAELHQLRLACVHVQLTSYWQKLGQELALHGHHGAGAGGSAALPAIDEVMARLRDQAQLQLQNAERDLCMVLNALAARLEATARKVQALAAKRLMQEEAAPGPGGGAAVGAARQGVAASAAAGATADEAGDGEEAVRSAGKPRAIKTRRRDQQQQLLNAIDNATKVGAHAAGAVASTDVAAEGEGAGAAAGATAEAESAVHPFRYNASGKTAAALSVESERLLREARELLETSWNVGENGIEAAAAAEGAAAAAAAGGAEVEKDIKAASASIRSWRFVQAHTSQLLADLLSTYGQLSAPDGNAASGAGPSSAPADAASTTAAAAAAGDAAAAATAASARAAELRAYVSSRVTDVRATADRELQRTRERLDRINATIARLRQQLVEEYGSAVAHGLPTGVVPEPRPWMDDVQARLEAARQVEAARRVEQQAAAAEGATLALMGKEVGALLSSEEAAVTRQRVGLDAAAGSMLVAAAVERLRAADRGLRVGAGHGHGQLLEPGPDWRSVLVGGVTMLLPPEGATSLAGDPQLAARAGWCLCYPPALGLLRHAVCRATESQSAESAARGIAHGFDHMTVLLCERHLRHPIRMLDSRLQEQRKTAEHHSTAKLTGRGLAMLLPALEAVRLRIELLRTWKEHNTAELLVEVAQHQCEVVTGEVMAAAQGQVAGMSSLLRQSEEELRNQVAQLKARCAELRHKKSFFQNQYLEATRLRHGGPSTAAAAAGSADHRPPASQPHTQRTQPAAAVSQPPARGPAGTTAASTPAPATATDVTTAAAAARTRDDNISAAGAGPSKNAPTARGSGQPDPPGQAGAAAARPPEPGAIRTEHVGVARCTGIMACLHPWEQWRPGHHQRSSPPGRGGAQLGKPADVLDLTGADDIDVDPAAVASRGGIPASTAAPGGGAAAAAAEPDRRQGALKPAAGPAGGNTATFTTAAADVEGAAEAEAAAAVAPTARSGHPDRAAAAAAAARARVAAEMASARARLGLGLGAVDGGMGDDGDGKEAEEEGLTCAVCADTLTTEIRLFPCGHYYCATCSGVILGPTGNRRCPTCRFDVRDKEVVKVGGLSAIGAAAGGPGAGGALSRLRVRAGLISDGSGEVDPPEGQHILSVKIEGGSGLMCKIGALMRRLVWLRDNRPAEKSLVFSQWSDALQIVERGLRTNGIGYVTLETGRKMRAAMSAFLNDDSCRVFLLSLRQGAAGLTLVRANHVFLLEPSLDPAIEQQAVARVHRIGQTRDVTVTRLLVDGTVEEAVMRMLKEKQQLFMEGVAAAAGSASGTRGPASSSRHSGAGPSTSAAPQMLQGGEGEEVSLPTAAPRQEVLAGADMSYLLDAVLR